MSNLCEVRIDDIAQLKYGKMPPKELVVGNGYPVFSGYRVTGCVKEYLYANPKLVVVARGVGGTGDVKISPSQSWITNLCIVLELDNDAVNQKYLFYKLLREPLKEKLNTGTAQSQITIKSLKSYRIRIHELVVQERIASLLSAYDELIQINQQRITLLERAGREIYREWFVRLRFPGYERTKIVDGVPETWKRVHLSRLVSTQYGYTASANEEPVGPKFLRGTDINKHSYVDWSTVPYCPEDGLDFEKYALKRGDLLVIRMADPGKVAIVEKQIRAIFASYLVRLSVQKDAMIDPLYLFYVLAGAEYQGFMQAASAGSTRKSASAKLLTNFNVLRPPETIQTRFVDQIRPMREMIGTLLDQNSRAGMARDLLLPRLMSGQLIV